MDNDSAYIMAVGLLAGLLVMTIRGLKDDCNVLMTFIFVLVFPTIMTTAVVYVIIRVQWDFASLEERRALLSGGTYDLRIQALVLWYLIFRLLKAFITVKQ